MSPLLKLIQIFGLVIPDSAKAFLLYFQWMIIYACPPHFFYFEEINKIHYFLNQIRSQFFKIFCDNFLLLTRQTNTEIMSFRLVRNLSLFPIRSAVRSPTSGDDGLLYLLARLIVSRSFHNLFPPLFVYIRYHYLLLSCKRVNRGGGRFFHIYYPNPL